MKIEKIASGSNKKLANNAQTAKSKNCKMFCWVIYGNNAEITVWIKPFQTHKCCIQQQTSVNRLLSLQLADRPRKAVG